MSRNFRLRPISEDEDSRGEESKLIDRRDFLRYSFNTAAGGITLASLGSIGFASLLDFVCSFLSFVHNFDSCWIIFVFFTSEYESSYQNINSSSTRNSGSPFLDSEWHMSFFSRILNFQKKAEKPEDRMAPKLDSGIFAVFEKRFASKNYCRRS